MFRSLKEEVLAPHPENDDVVNDFDIEEEVIEVENRFDNFASFACILSHQIKNGSLITRKSNIYLCCWIFVFQERKIWQKLLAE